MAEQSDRIPQKASPQTFKVFAGLPERHDGSVVSPPGEELRQGEDCHELSGR
jgi:hypothetical protein